MKKSCPVNRMKPCIEDDCMWWTQVLMKDVATQQVDKVGNCAMSWIPEMLKEQNRNTIGVAAAVESRGNEMIDTHKLTNQIFAGMAQLVVNRHELGSGPGDLKELPGADPT